MSTLTVVFLSITVVAFLSFIHSYMTYREKSPEDRSLDLKKFKAMGSFYTMNISLFAFVISYMVTH